MQKYKAEARALSLIAAWKAAREKGQKLAALMASRSERVQPGDIMMLRSPENEEAIQWIVLGSHVEDEDLLLCVPADVFPLVGTADVEVPDSAACGSLSLRCGASLWIPRGFFLGEPRVGVLEEEWVVEANEKMSQVFSGRLFGTEEQHEGDADIELDVHMRFVGAYVDSVMDGIAEFSA